MIDPDDDDINYDDIPIEGDPNDEWDEDELEEAFNDLYDGVPDKTYEEIMEYLKTAAASDETELLRQLVRRLVRYEDVLAMIAGDKAANCSHAGLAEDVLG